MRRIENVHIFLLHYYIQGFKKGLNDLLYRDKPLYNPKENIW